MAFSLSDYGWEAPVCPPVPAEKWVLDSNDIFALTVPQEYFDYNGNGTSPHYAPELFGNWYRVPIAIDNSNLILGQKTIQGNPMNIYTGWAGHPGGNHIRQATATISFWMSFIGPAPSVSVNLTYASINIFANRVEIFVDSNGTSTFPVNIPADGSAHFIRLIRDSAYLWSVYIDGQFIGSKTHDYATPFINSVSISSTARIRDFVVSKVARSGSFLPNNLIGF